MSTLTLVLTLLSLFAVWSINAVFALRWYRNSVSDDHYDDGFVVVIVIIGPFLWPLLVLTKMGKFYWSTIDRISRSI
ncbi:MAG: hypothetical protein DKT66_23450 [Candidatus Melainabacteria bacterium]|mgnify:CR=1 FL=1|jgi:hypothetical protein|nr:MAG: hypothetical protein DKT66_23450 [Candidatus Melainabacteria bacterium]